MTITSKVQSQFFESEQQLIRIAQDAKARAHGPTKRNGTPWSADEHDRFLRALEKHPSGPWKVIAWSVGTRTTRQTMTHAQKYREKIARHKRVSEQTEALARCSDGFAYNAVSTDAAIATSIAATAAATATPAGSVIREVCTVDSTTSADVDVATALPASNLDDLFLPPDVDANDAAASAGEMLDATIALLLDSYEPLDIDDDGSDDDNNFWRDLEAFSQML